MILTGPLERTVQKAVQYKINKSDLHLHGYTSDTYDLIFPGHDDRRGRFWSGGNHEYQRRTDKGSG